MCVGSPIAGTSCSSLWRPDDEFETDRFDLVIATNVLVYYSVFEQSLSLTNIARMLRPGALFLSNTELAMLPALPILRLGYTEMVYSDRANAADRLVWFQRLPSN